MNKLVLYQIDEELGSSEVEQLCFLCSDVIKRRSLEKVKDAKALFTILEEKGLLDNSAFLCQLLKTIHRVDLLRKLQSNTSSQVETDAVPILSTYRVMLYDIYEDITKDNLDRMKFLLAEKLGKRKLEISKTALDVFTEMEKMEIMSKTNVDELHRVLQQFDQKLAMTVWNYMQGLQQPLQQIRPHVSMDQQGLNNTATVRPQPFLSIADTQPSCGGESIYSDANPVFESSSLSNEKEYYSLTHNPRGLCVVINNEKFIGSGLNSRSGTHKDASALENLFKRLGFQVVIHNNLTGNQIRHEITNLGERDFVDDDALVICVLSHGEMGSIFGVDENEVRLPELTGPFKSGRAPTLAGKPKLFFIQACQGKNLQIGVTPCRTKSRQEDIQIFKTDGPTSVPEETVPSDADFLIGMATVPDYKAFRNIYTGSIYIQELCRQLDKSAKSSENDDILTVLTRVNREVSKGVYSNFKQMPEPKYTLTKKLVFKYV